VTGTGRAVCLPSRLKAPGTSTFTQKGGPLKKKLKARPWSTTTAQKRGWGQKRKSRKHFFIPGFLRKRKGTENVVRRATGGITGGKYREKQNRKKGPKGGKSTGRKASDATVREKKSGRKGRQAVTLCSLRGVGRCRGLGGHHRSSPGGLIDSETGPATNRTVLTVVY